MELSDRFPNLFDVYAKILWTDNIRFLNFFPLERGIFSLLQFPKNFQSDIKIMSYL